MVEKITITITAEQTDRGTSVHIQVDPVNVFVDDALMLMQRAVTVYERMSIVAEALRQINQLQQDAIINQLTKGKLI